MKKLITIFSLLMTVSAVQAFASEDDMQTAVERRANQSDEVHLQMSAPSRDDKAATNDRVMQQPNGGAYTNPFQSSLVE